MLHTPMVIEVMKEENLSQKFNSYIISTVFCPQT
jgi:hypothetical protein